MKKIALVLAIVLLFLKVGAQTITPQGSATQIYWYKGGVIVDSFSKVAPTRDTTSYFGRKSDFVRLPTDNNRLYYYDGSKYIKFNSSGSSGIDTTFLYSVLDSFARKGDSTILYVTPIQLSDSLENINLQRVTANGNQTTNIIQVTGSDNANMNIRSSMLYNYGNLVNGGGLGLSDGAGNFRRLIEASIDNGQTIVYNDIHNQSLLIRAQTSNNSAFIISGRMEGQPGINAGEFVTLQQLQDSNQSQNLSSNKTDNNVMVNITGGTGTKFSVSDADSVIGNELQTFSRSGDTITLSNGGGSFIDSVKTYNAGSNVFITGNYPNYTINAISGGGGSGYTNGFGLNLSDTTFSVDTSVIATINNVNAIPTFYNSNGTLTSGRTVNANGNSLAFTGISEGSITGDVLTLSATDGNLHLNGSDVIYINGTNGISVGPGVFSVNASGITLGSDNNINIGANSEAMINTNDGIGMTVENGPFFVRAGNPSYGVSLRTDSLTGNHQVMAANADGFPVFSVNGIPANNAGNVTIPPFDTSGIYGQINQRVKYTDSGTVYVTKFQSDTAKSNLGSSIAQKLNISDTGTMLAPYLRKVDTAGLSSRIDQKIPLSQKGAPNGVVPTNGSNKIDIAYMPDAVVGAVNYQGTWSVVNNTPTLPSPVGNKGWYYTVTDSGLYSGNSTVYKNGDWIISNGTVWQKVDNNNAVTSVNGMVGAVTISALPPSGAAGGDLSGTYPNPTVARLNGQLPSFYLSRANHTGTQAQNTVIGLPDSISAHRTAINGKEPIIAAGTTSQYWRGDKTWQTINWLTSETDPLSIRKASPTQANLNFWDGNSSIYKISGSSTGAPFAWGDWTAVNIARDANTGFEIAQGVGSADENLYVRRNNSGTMGAYQKLAYVTDIPSLTGFVQFSDTNSTIGTKQNIKDSASAIRTTLNAHIGSGGASHAAVTTSVNGFMIASDKSKLDGISAGAEVNVNPDWSATSGDANILNKPTPTGIMVGIGTPAYTAVTGTANQLLRRNSGNTAYEFFTPSYLTSETDPVANAKTVTISSGTGISITGAAQTVGNNPAFTVTNTGDLSTTNEIQSLSLGTATTTGQPVNISLGGTGVTLPSATTSTAGLQSAADKSKLDNIQSGAEVNVQANWTETNPAADAYIQNKPTTFPADSAVFATIYQLDTSYDNLNAAISTKEPVITAGTTNQYWRGDKTWQTIDWLTSEVDGVIGNEYQNLGTGTVTATAYPITISNGTGITLAAVTTSLAGLMVATDKSKLDGIAIGAEVNVNADWNASSGDANILNKPSPTGVMIGVGTAAYTGVAGTASQLLRRNASNTAYEFFTPTYLTSETDPLSIRKASASQTNLNFWDGNNSMFKVASNSTGAPFVWGDWSALNIARDATTGFQIVQAATGSDEHFYARRNNAGTLGSYNKIAWATDIPAQVNISGSNGIVTGGTYPNITITPTFGTGANTIAQGNDSRFHNAVTIGTANGLSLSTQQLSLGLASSSTPGAVSAADWNTFNGKAPATGGTGYIQNQFASQQAADAYFDSARVNAIRVDGLSGSGDRAVAVDASGNLKTMTVTSGSYTPTLTGLPTGTFTPNGFTYMRIGNEVHVKGVIAFSGVSVGTISFDISLPIASDLTNTYDLKGGVNGASVSGTGSLISGETTNNRATAACNIDALNGTAVIDFRYTVQ